MKTVSTAHKLMRLQLMTETSRYALVVMLNWLQFYIEKPDVYVTDTVTGQ